MPGTEATAPSFKFAAARSAADIAAARTLFSEYAQGLGVDLAFQDFATELQTLPGKYAPPAGELLLARAADGAVLGCVALRPLEGAGICEMKRLYVRPEGRRRGLGGALVAAILTEAEARSYREIRLDTLPEMAAALALYRRFGFREIAAYYHNPVAGTVYLSLPLGRAMKRSPSTL